MEDSSDVEMEDNVDENQAYLFLWKKAIDYNDDKYDKLYNQFIQDGEDEESAQDMTEDRIQPYNERTFFTKYEYLFGFVYSATSKQYTASKDFKRHTFIDTEECKHSIGY